MLKKAFSYIKCEFFSLSYEKKSVKLCKEKNKQVFDRGR